MNPGSRPRRGTLAILGAFAVAAAVTTAVVIGPSTEAEASGLSTFASCAELQTWGAEAVARQGSPGDDMWFDADMAPTAAREASTESSAAGFASDDSVTASEGSAAGAPPSGGDEGGTNVAVEGVDELDLVDTIEGDVVLVASGDRLAIVDLAAGEQVTSVPVGWQAQITYDREAGIVWVVDHSDSGNVRVQRFGVTAASLSHEGEWTSSGQLVDARRVGGELHVVASEGFSGIAEAVPFEDGPVPCDQVLHPVGPSTPTATLIATLSATGPVEPVRATEVVGSGQFVHVTLDAAYLATPLWESTEPSTAIHRFDLATLIHTGSGQVGGTLLNEFSMSAHGDHLRVAVTHGGGRMLPLPVEPMPGGDGDILNEIVVLDTDGDLDIVGQTHRFGHPGETIHGIRFVGTVAYAVTFLTTDPFYVIDLADPINPVIRGELELPGFSAYLHPMGDDLVVGFGPDARGEAAVKLFDVSDRTRPRLVDELTLGAESAVVWDHHAYVDLGSNRFAVPVGQWREAWPVECTPTAREEARIQNEELERGLVDLERRAIDDPDLWEEYDRRWAEASTHCLYPEHATVGSVVEVSVSGGGLVEEARHSADLNGTVQRAITSTQGWALLGEGQIVLLDDAGTVRGTLRIS